MECSTLSIAARLAAAAPIVLNIRMGQAYISNNADYRRTHELGKVRNVIIT